MDPEKSKRVEPSHLLEKLCKGHRIAIIGIGNPLRGDDAAGSYIAKLLKKRLSKEISERLLIVDAESAPENFLGVIVDFNPDIIVFIDAVNAGLKPGSIVMLPIDNFDDTVTLSTHKISLKALGEYLKKCTRVKDIFIIGVQVAQVTMGTPMCTEVREACNKLSEIMEEILEELG